MWNFRGKLKKNKNKHNFVQAIIYIHMIYLQGHNNRFEYQFSGNLKFGNESFSLVVGRVTIFAPVKTSSLFHASWVFFEESELWNTGCTTISKIYLLFRHITSHSILMEFWHWLEFYHISFWVILFLENSGKFVKE